MMKSTLKTNPLWLLAALPLLAGCVDDTASLRLGGNDHALTLQARQAWFWKQEADLEVVMARPPDCLRRSRLEPVALGALAVDVLRPEEGVFAEPILILRQGTRFYAVSTKNCELQPFRAAPASPGTPLGTFRLEGKKLAFHPAPAKAAAPAAPASPPPAAPAQ